MFYQCFVCRNQSRIEAEEDEVSESGQSSSKSDRPETEVKMSFTIYAFLYDEGYFINEFIWCVPSPAGPPP